MNNQPNTQTFNGAISRLRQATSKFFFRCCLALGIVSMIERLDDFLKELVSDERR